MIIQRFSSFSPIVLTKLRFYGMIKINLKMISKML